MFLSTLTTHSGVFSLLACIFVYTVERVLFALVLIDSGRIQDKGEYTFSYRMYSQYCIWANSKPVETEVFHDEWAKIR